MTTASTPDRSSVGRHVLDPLPIEVERGMVVLRLGYRRPSQVSERTSRMLEEVMETGRPLLQPKAVYSEADVSQPSPGVTLIGAALRTESRSVHRRMATCRSAAAFAATIGPGIDEWSHRLMDAGEMARALLADAYGSSAAIALGDAIRRIIGRNFKARGLQATKIYSPGYGDWALDAQKPLLAMLDAAAIGLRLTEDHLMIPAKSISGIIGGR